MHIHLLNSLVTAAVSILVYMSLCFVASIIFRRNDVADIGWGLGFVITSFIVLISNHNERLTTFMVFLLVLIWGIRLSSHILLRNIKKPEDFRYKVWRDSWGKWFYLRSYFQIYILQGILMLLILLPVLAILSEKPFNNNPLLIVGLVVWVFGFIFETIGDRQLTKFLEDKNRKVKIMQQGLWKYSRHPNYFGEITQWWAIGLIALAVDYGWLALIGPLTITFLITKISGIPLLEKNYANNPEYTKYKLKTSILIPLPTKRPIN